MSYSPACSLAIFGLKPLNPLLNGFHLNPKLNGSSIVVGRGKESDVVLKHNCISKRHALLKISGDISGGGVASITRLCKVVVGPSKGLVLSCLLSCLVFYCLVLSLSSPLLSWLVFFCPVFYCLLFSCLVLSCPVLSCVV
jgi:hypothetical protein